MSWDPGGLEVRKISPTKLGSDQLDVTITLTGIGFQDPVYAIFVCTATKRAIPCNFLNYINVNTVQVRICTNNELEGSYDLIVWLPPPANGVVGEDGQAQANVPVNARSYLRKALQIVHRSPRTS